jgi:hypothetical protein
MPGAVVLSPTLEGANVAQPATVKQMASTARLNGTRACGRWKTRRRTPGKNIGYLALEWQAILVRRLDNAFGRIEETSTPAVPGAAGKRLAWGLSPPALSATVPLQNRCVNAVYPV